MLSNQPCSLAWRYCRSGFATVALFQFTVATPMPAMAQDATLSAGKPTTPIQHVIVVVGENRTFDHIFATYEPKTGQHVDNLRSKHIFYE